jgi:hypothetical protein
MVYKGALMRWASRYQEDPFAGLSKTALRGLKQAFTNTFLEKPEKLKIQITDEIFSAVMSSLDASSELDAIDADLYTVFKIAGTRVSSLVLGSDNRKWKRVVRMKHVTFLPDEATRHRAFLLLPATKTRHEYRPVGMILKKNPDEQASTCAVDSLWRQVCRRREQGASKNEVLFVNLNNNKPMSRNVFTTRLKKRVDMVCSRRIGNTRLKRPPSSYIAGISFRKAVLQKLKDAGLQPTQIATYASHKSINAQMSYVAETYQASGDIARALYNGLA